MSKKLLVSLLLLAVILNVVIADEPNVNQGRGSKYDEEDTSSPSSGDNSSSDP